MLDRGYSIDRDQEMIKNCNTCAYAVITIVNECSKKLSSGEYAHDGGFCLDCFTCKYWEQMNLH